MATRSLGSLSRFLSLILRHKPEVVGLQVDDAGWVTIDNLLIGCRANGRNVTRDEIAEVVRTSDKQRFALSEDGLRIRAQQGHSVDVELGYQTSRPPTILFHGTVAKFLPAIRGEGLKRGARSHVHLSERFETAEKVGDRRGKAVILEVHAAEMAADGHAFFLTPNGVWLTEAVPIQYLRFPPGG